MLVPELALQALPGRRGPEGLPRPAHPEAVALSVRALTLWPAPPRTAGDRHVRARLIAKSDGQTIRDQEQPLGRSPSVACGMCRFPPCLP
jgi:hypothetical protein